MDYLMDHCIAVDSNLRMQEQFIQNVKLTFKETKMEDEVKQFKNIKDVNKLYVENCSMQ